MSDEVTTEYTPTDDPTGGWGATFHRHFASNEIHRDGGPECTQPGSPRPVYVFDPDVLAAHDREVAELRAQREAVLALHVEEVRYTHASWAEHSWESIREMWESIYSAPVDANGEYTVDPDGYDADDLTDEQLDAWFKREGGTTFSVCAECARIEVEDRMERGCYGPDVEWPCRTVRAMGVTE